MKIRKHRHFEVVRAVKIHTLWSSRLKHHVAGRRIRTTWRSKQQTEGRNDSRLFNTHSFNLRYRTVLQIYTLT